MDILQQPVFLVIAPLCARLGIDSALIRLRVGTLVLVLLSCLTFQYFEEPMRRRILARVRPAVA